MSRPSWGLLGAHIKEKLKDASSEKLLVLPFAIIQLAGSKSRLQQHLFSSSLCPCSV